MRLALLGEAIMQLLLGSAQRILPHIKNMANPGVQNGEVGKAMTGGSASNNTPSATPRLDSRLNVTFIQTGGTIDKGERAKRYVHMTLIWTVPEQLEAGVKADLVIRLFSTNLVSLRSVQIIRKHIMGG